MSLAVSIMQWTAPKLTKTMSTQGPGANFSAHVQCKRSCTRTLAPTQILAWALEKKGVITLMPSEYRTPALCPGTKCERCLRKQAISKYIIRLNI